MKAKHSQGFLPHLAPKLAISGRLKNSIKQKPLAWGSLLLVLALLSYYGINLMQVMVQEYRHQELVSEKPIESLQVEIRIKPDKSLSVFEQVQVRIKKSRTIHGINRWLRTSYEDSSGKSHRVSITMKNATLDQNPLSIPAAVNKPRGVIYALGSPKKELEPGLHDFTLQYTASNQIVPVSGRDELQWEVFGGLEVEVESALVVVRLPQYLERDTVQVRGEIIDREAIVHKGPEVVAAVVERDPDAVEERSIAKFWLRDKLQPFEIFRIYVSWPTGFL